MKRIISAAATALVASATFASASMLEIVGGVAGSIPGGQTNEILADMGEVSLGGFFGGQIELSGPTQTLRFELLGFEAGNRNRFETFYSGDLFDTDTFGSDTVLPSEGPNGQFEVGAYGISGLLGFVFATNGVFNTPPGGQVAFNGINPTNASPDTANFFASFGDDSTTSGRHLYLFFDDAGAGDDDNHDDLVIRISAVPLPMSGLLLLAGLGGLGVASRRRKS